MSHLSDLNGLFIMLAKSAGNRALELENELGLKIARILVTRNLADATIVRSELFARVVNARPSERRVLFALGSVLLEGTDIIENDLAEPAFGT